MTRRIYFIHSQNTFSVESFFSVSVFFDIWRTVPHWWARSTPIWLPGEAGGVASGWWMIACRRAVFWSVKMRIVSSVWFDFFVIALFTVCFTMSFTNSVVLMFIPSSLRRTRQSRGTKSVQQKALVCTSQRTFHPRIKWFNQLSDANYIRELLIHLFMIKKSF